MLTIPISAIFVGLLFIIIGLLFTLLITTIFCFGSDRAWRYTIPIGQLISWSIYATQQGWIIWN